VRSTTDASGKIEVHSSKGSYVCDDHPNEQHDGGFVNDFSVQNIAAGGTSISSADDMPSEELTDTDVKASATDEFKLYLMYRPDGKDSIWVTLSVIRWNWSGSATNTAGNWSVDPGAHPPPKDPVGSDSTELPKWDDYFDNL
jgi:hypothetical protein